TDSKGNRHVLKVLRTLTPNPDQILSFNNEYDFTKDLKISGVRKALFTTKFENKLAIGFEFIEGDTLENKILSQQISVLEQLKIYVTIADILTQIHNQGIIHKDINGRNILWDSQTQQPVLIDFGISTHIDLINTNLGNPDRVKGTLSHMSPEQTGRVNRKIDSRSDLYSLGVTMYKSLTGQLPFIASDSLELVHYQLAKSIPQAHLVNAKIPVAVSNIIIKLMAKNAEDRYQSAVGLKHDLAYCIRQIENGETHIDFKIGQHDVSGKFQIPQKLYGRDKEIDVLLKSFDAVSQGSTEWFLVSGYSGIGKSVLIGELYKPITERRGHFAEGKFDQYQRNIPYYAFTLAINEFCRLLLTESKAKLQYWQNLIQQGVGENGSILIELAPALADIIGEQEEAPKLDAMEALNRFNITFVNFIRAIAQPEHPFVFFIDDLQWADVGSLNLIKTMVCDLSLPHLMVIGAYRDNEVTPGHPLLHTIDAAIKDKAIVKSIQLKPLLAEHIFQLVKDVLHTEDKITLSLTELIFSKTQGNAFFTIEFLKSLYHFDLIVFNQEKNLWDVNIDEIKKRKITDNVIDFLIAKISELPLPTQHVLQLASCIGGLFDINLLSTLYDKPAADTLNDLWPAVLEGLVLPLNENYKLIEHIEVSQQAKFEFAHDRIQQASFTLMPATRQAAVHLQIGRLLLSNHPDTDDVIFDIVNHCNEGITLINIQTEKDKLAQLNLQAAIQAKNSSAYKSASVYIDAAQKLAGDAIWQSDYDFALKLFTNHAEIDYLNGNLEQSQNSLLNCIERAQTAAEKSSIYFMLMQNQNNSTQYYEAIESARQGLQLLNFTFPQKDDCPALIPDEMGKIISYFEAHGVESVFDKQTIQDQGILSTINILDNLSPPTYV
ncbi:MAG TPA: serine/threonine-protein kinase PknK, partial [Bacteroidia bacterium]|nr:serine/threonine-protein kinase PknK [Bacteroidia bacterium]